MTNHFATVADAPPGHHRPAFWRWFQLNECKLRDEAGKLGVSHTQLFLIMLPWTDPRRAEPSDDLKAAIETRTGGAVTAAESWIAPDPAGSR